MRAEYMKKQQHASKSKQINIDEKQLVADIVNYLLDNKEKIHANLLEHNQKCFLSSQNQIADKIDVFRSQLWTTIKSDNYTCPNDKIINGLTAALEEIVSIVDDPYLTYFLKQLKSCNESSREYTKKLHDTKRTFAAKEGDIEQSKLVANLIDRFRTLTGKSQAIVARASNITPKELTRIVCYQNTADRDFMLTDDIKKRMIAYFEKLISKKLRQDELFQNYLEDLKKTLHDNSNDNKSTSTKKRKNSAIQTIRVDNDIESEVETETETVEQSLSDHKRNKHQTTTATILANLPSQSEHAITYNADMPASHSSPINTHTDCIDPPSTHEMVEHTNHCSK